MLGCVVLCVGWGRIGDLSNPRLRFRVQTNARELRVTGLCLVVFGCAHHQLVLAEGSPRQMRKYIGVLTRRVNWGMPFPAAGPAGEGEGREESKRAGHQVKFPSTPLIGPSEN
jgi:U4/U6 small nuclear ribonucleoprotein PRP3